MPLQWLRNAIWATFEAIARGIRDPRNHRKTHSNRQEFFVTKQNNRESVLFVNGNTAQWRLVCYKMWAWDRRLGSHGNQFRRRAVVGA